MDPECRARCLDGCDSIIALPASLCAHAVVSQIVWADAVAAWTDLHDVRFSNGEVEAATTSLDSDGLRFEHRAALAELVGRLPNLKTFRGAGDALTSETVGKLEEIDCVDRLMKDNLVTDSSNTPKLRTLCGVCLMSIDQLRSIVQRLHNFTGFAWPRADEYPNWLFPASPQLTHIRLGYVRPQEVLDILSRAPTTMIDIALQGWTQNDPMGRETVFNSKETLPNHLEGFELLDDDGTFSPTRILRIWRFIEPAAARLRCLVLSAPMSSIDLVSLIRGCNVLEEFSVALFFNDDPDAARYLLFSNVGLPRLRRLSVFVASGKDSSHVWPALLHCAESNDRDGEATLPQQMGETTTDHFMRGRKTITALLLKVEHAVTGAMLRPFAPRLTELAVCDLNPSIELPHQSATQDKHHTEAERNGTPGGAGDEEDRHDTLSTSTIFPVFPLLTTLTIRVLSELQFQRTLPFTPRLRRVFCQSRECDAAADGYIVTDFAEWQTGCHGFRRRGVFEFI